MSTDSSDSTSSTYSISQESVEDCSEVPSSQGYAYNCTKCDDLFLTKSERDYHTQKQHILSINVGQHLVERNSDSLWKCPGCERNYKTIKGIKAHFRRVHINMEIVTNEQPLSQEENTDEAQGADTSNSSVSVLASQAFVEVYREAEDSDLLDDGIIGQFGFIINTKHVFAFCKNCRKMLSVQRIIRHLRQECKDKRNVSTAQKNMLKAQLNEIFQDGFSGEEFNYEANTVDPIEGIPVEHGFRCTECNY